jgi:mRNA-degrading endonuclease toxin of MazEF toxin-antitoxin module
VVVPIYSHVKSFADTYVNIPAREGGIPHDSMAKCDQITTIDKSLLADGPLGDRINQALMWKIHYAVRRALGETRVP